MLALEPVTLALIAALAIGLAFGAFAERSQFCVVSGVREASEGRGTDKLRAVIIATLVAIAGTQALAGFGLIELGGVAPYLPATGSVFAVAVGGLLFGLGAVAARGCLGRLTVLTATGNLRALIVILVAAIIAYATMRGLLAVPRSGLQALWPSDVGSPDLAQRVAGVAGLESNRVRLGAAGLAGLAALTLMAVGRVRWRLLAGAVIGLLVVAGWAATGIIGADDFDPAPLASLAFAQPLAQSVVYAMTATGMKLEFGIALVAGVLLGAGLAARLAGTASLQSFHEPGQMLRYLVGAALMGFGAVLAAGCTTGQGLTGISTLAPLSFVALAAMLGGIRLGLLIEKRAEHREVKLVTAGAR